MPESMQPEPTNEINGFMPKTASALERVVRLFANIMCWSYALLVLAILTNVTLRYGFSNGLIIFEEIQWHLYAIGMMFGLSYAEITNSQVRVDIVADRLQRRTVRKWEIFGSVVFVLPFIFVIVFNSWEYVSYSFSIGETSDSPLGLPFRWAIKAVIPISFVLLLLAVVSRMLRNVQALLEGQED